MHARWDQIIQKSVPNVWAENMWVPDANRELWAWVLGQVSGIARLGNVQNQARRRGQGRYKDGFGEFADQSGN